MTEKTVHLTVKGNVPRRAFLADRAEALAATLAVFLPAIEQALDALRAAGAEE